MRIANNLLEIYYNILENLKDKLEPFIENLLKAPDEDKISLVFLFVFGSTICRITEVNQGTT